jgi:hypothetical protein
MRYSIAMKWAKALRSGKYPQTNGVLRDSNGFCCLGVLCNLHAQAHPEIAVHEINPYEYIGEDTELPKAVVEWAEIKGGGSAGFPEELRPSYRRFDDDKNTTIATCLVDLNDDAQWNFKKISAFIRKNYKLL